MRGADTFTESLFTMHHLEDFVPANRQRQRAQPWSAWQEAQCDGDRDRALHQAYRQGGMTMTQLSRDAGLSVSHVSRLIAGVEKEK
jgi:hypothetical protein